MQIAKKRALTAVLMVMLLFPINAFAKETRPPAGKFPDRTIIIGTHAIVLDAMTNEILKVSQKSAEKAEQYNVYFKSDINSGTWYDITDSTNISQISVTRDNIVTNDVIDAVLLTHYTKISGETVDFSTGDATSVAALADLSNPAQMKEMEEVVMEKDVQAALASGAKGDTKKFAKVKLESIDKVLKPVPEKYLISLNEQIAGIEKFMKEVPLNAEQKNMAANQKISLEDNKDAICYQVEYNRLDEQTRELSYEDCSDLIEKYTIAMTAMQSSISETGVTTEEIAKQIDKANEEEEERKKKEKEEKKKAGDKEEKEEEKEEEEKEKEEIIVVEVDETDEEIKAVVSPLKAMTDKAMADFVEAAKENNMEAAKAALDNAVIIQSVMSNDKNVSNDIKQKQLEILQQAKQNASATAMDIAAKSGTNEQYIKAQSEGASNETLEKLAEDIAAEVASAVAEVVSLTDMAVERQTDTAKKLAELQNTKGLLKNISSTVTGKAKKDAKTAIDALLVNVDDAIAEAKLSEVPEYLQLKKASADALANKNALYEDYMGANEEGEVQKAQQIKAELDKAVEISNNCDDAVKLLEDAVKNGTLDVDPVNLKVADNSGVLEKANKALADAGVKTSTDQPGTGQPGTGQTGTGQTGTGQTGINQPGTDQPGTGQTGTEQTGTGQTGTDQTGTSQPGTGQTGAGQTGTGQPGTEQSGTSQPGTGQIGAGQTGTDQTGTDQTGTEQPGTGQPGTEQSGAGQLGAGQTGTNQPGAAQPGAGQIGTAQPGTGQPGTAQIDKPNDNDNRYTKAEVEVLRNTTAAMTAAGNGTVYLTPWKFIFLQYNVKLTSPVMVLGKEIYVPAEELALSIGAQVIKSNTNKAVVLRMGSGLIEYIPGNTTVYINDKQTPVKPAPYAVYGSRVYIPLSCFEKAFGFTSYTDDNQNIIVSKR